MASVALAAFGGSSDSESESSSLESEDSAVFAGVLLTGFAAGRSESESEESEDSSDEEAFFTAVEFLGATTADSVSESDSEDDDDDTFFVEGTGLVFEGIAAAGLARFAAASGFVRAGFFEVTLEDFGGTTGLAGTSDESDESSSSSSSSEEEDSCFEIATTLVTLGAGFSSSSESDDDEDDDGDFGRAFTSTALDFSPSSSDELSLLSSEDDSLTTFD